MDETAATDALLLILMLPLVEVLYALVLAARVLGND